MDGKLQRWVQRRGWDRAVDHYEPFWRDQLRPAHDALLGLADLSPGERVLDVACGTGMVTVRAARAVGPSGSVYATDISPRMVDKTAERAAACGLTNIATERADAEQLGAVGEFDAALCALGLMYVPVPTAALAEMARTLAPDGRMAVAVWGERRNCGWAEVFPIVDARVSSDVCPLFFGLGAPGALTNAATASGFVDVVEHRISTELRYDDEAAALGAAFLGGPVALAHARFDDDTRASAYAEYLASLAPFRSGAGYRVPAEFVVASARVAAAPHSRPLPTHMTTTAQEYAS